MAQTHAEILVNDVAGHRRAAEVLRRGDLLGLPTETVYGLAADATNARAVARIFEAKGRPQFNPLIVHVASLAAATEIAGFDPIAEHLAQAFWPGPLTLVLPLRGGVSDLVTGGLETVALRMPAHPAARAVLEAFGGPVAAPSANPSGQVSPTRAAHVIDGLGHRVDAVLDAGPCEVGLESTIVAPGPLGVRLLREGGIPQEKLEATLGTPVVLDVTPGRVEAPGQMERHYATETILLCGGTPPEGAVTIGFGPGKADFSLSAAGDLIEAAARLYDILRQADRLALTRKAPAIHIVDIPQHGLGAAINDRLSRAMVT